MSTFLGDTDSLMYESKYSCRSKTLRTSLILLESLGGARGCDE